MIEGRESFGHVCERVCESQGWELVPAGVRVQLPGGRRQVVSMEFFDFESQELVRFYTLIGAAEQLSTERLALALQINARLAHGALAVRDGELIMTDTHLLKDADAAEIEASIGYLAETADYYEKMLFGTDEH
jgi:hypothetical protein